MESLRIYIAGPYTPKDARDKHEAIRLGAHNVHTAIEAAIAILERGHFFYCPHLSHYIHTNPLCKREYKWYVFDNSILEHWANAIYLLPRWKDSFGAVNEYKRVKKRNYRIFEKIEEIPIIKPNPFIESYPGEIFEYPED